MVIPSPPYVDGGTGQKLLDASKKLLEIGRKHLVVNLEAVRAVNSLGIARLIEMLERFDQNGGCVAFCISSATVMKTFRIMGIARKAVLYGSIQEFKDAVTDSG